MSKTKRAPGIAVIHIEDEYFEFRGLVTVVRTIIEDHFVAQGNANFSAKLRKIASPAPQSEIWEIDWGDKQRRLVRYIFVGDKAVPQALHQFLLERCLFIVDVLRPDETGKTLSPTVEESMSSIDGLYKDISDVILFTAYEGHGFKAADAQIPRKLDKPQLSDLKDYLSERIVGYLDG